VPSFDSILVGIELRLVVARGVPFRKGFLGMAGLSLGVAAVSFFIGLILRYFLGVEI